MEQTPARLWNRSYIFLLVLSALSATAFNMVTPTLPRYAVSLGAGLTIAGTLAGIFALTALTVRPLSGLAVDRMNKKHLLVGATALMSLAVVGYTLSDRIPVLFAFRILHGAAFAISGTANTALAVTYIPRERLGEGVGYLGLGFIMATAVGPTVGLGLADAYGYHASFYLSGAMLAATSLLMLTIRHTFSRSVRVPGTVRARIRLGDLFATELGLFAVLAGLLSVSNGVTNTFLPLLAIDRGIPNIGLFYTVSALTMLAVRLFAGKLLDRYGLGVIVYPAFLVSAVALVLLARAYALPLILLAAALRSIGQSAGQPALQATCIRRLGPLRTGVATSTFFVGADVGQGLGPIVGGAVSEAWGYGAMYTGTAVLLLLGMAIYRLSGHSQREAVSKRALT